MTPREAVYPISDAALSRRLGLDGVVAEGGESGRGLYHCRIDAVRTAGPWLPDVGIFVHQGDESQAAIDTLGRVAIAHKEAAVWRAGARQIRQDVCEQRRRDTLATRRVEV